MAARRALHRSFSTATSRKEYPTSFLSHLRTQKLNVFNIGVAFMTLSLSSQMVSYKQRYETAREEKQQLSERVEALETLVLDLGGVLPDAQARNRADAAASQQTTQSQALCDREDEAKALAALATDGKTSKTVKLI